jgi:hypothetical protein
MAAAPTVAALVSHYGRTQRGRGANDQFGQIYSGSRFPLRQRGGGIGTFLGGVVRGISSLLSKTPSWVKSGAKLVGQSALQGMANYSDDRRAGIDKQDARKRALKSVGANIAKGIGQQLSEGGGRRRGKKRKKCVKKGGGGGPAAKRRPTKKSMQKGGSKGKGIKKKKKRCCKLKQLGGKRKKKKSTKAQRKSGKKRRQRPASASRLGWLKSIKGRSKFDLLS